MKSRFATVIQNTLSSLRKREPGSHDRGHYFSESRSWVRAVAGMTLLLTSGAYAQTASGDQFADGANGAKVHLTSGFVCPARIGAFERDAVGESDPETAADFCAYSALDGIYGTITLTPLHGAYDPKLWLADDFAEQEGTGGKQIAEGAVEIAARNRATPVSVYTRTYETAKLEDLHYRVTYTGAAMGNWVVQTTLEYAEPRDTNETRLFLHAVYAGAQSEIAKAH